MHTSCAVTGFATKRGADSGWASQLEDVPKGHKIQGVGTKTQERDFNFERRSTEFTLDIDLFLQSRLIEIL